MHLAKKDRAGTGAKTRYECALGAGDIATPDKSHTPVSKEVVRGLSWGTKQSPQNWFLFYLVIITKNVQVLRYIYE